MNAANGARREEQFRRVMATRGIALVRPPRVFRFTYTTYRPDFYAPATDTYYEVIGSRQRAQQMAPTFDLMATLYPAVRFQIVRPDGETIVFRTLEGRRRWLDALPFGNQLEDRMRCEGLRVADVASYLGLSSPSFYKAMHGQRLDLQRLEAFALGREAVRRSA